MVYTLRFFSLQNAVCFIILTYLVPVLFKFYIQGVLKLKKIYFRLQKLKLMTYIQYIQECWRDKKENHNNKKLLCVNYTTAQP